MDAAAPRLGPLTRADRDAVFDVDQWAFAYDPHELDPAAAEGALEWDRSRSLVARPGGAEELAGMCGVYSLRMSLPHAGDPLPLLPVAGLTWVGVHPQYGVAASCPPSSPTTCVPWPPQAASPCRFSFARRRRSTAASATAWRRARCGSRWVGGRSCAPSPTATT